MVGQSVRRLVGQAIRLAVVAPVLLTAYPPNRLAGQVGHDPARSPFRDIPRGGGLRISVGHLGGERGRVGVGHANGRTWGLRYELPVGGAASFAFGFAYAETDRYVVDPTKDEDVRKTGPFPDDALIADAGLLFRLTGAKTWHGLAPHLGGAIGLAISRGSPTDASGYEFGTKFTFAPGVGLRWYLARRLSVQADARVLYWRLNYPLDYLEPLSPDSTTVLPAGAERTEWTRHPWVSIGVGWTF